MSGVELVLAFLAGVVMGGALDRFVLPLLVDAWIDPAVPSPGIATSHAWDLPAIAAWRVRMGTPEAKAIARERSSSAECVNALARNRGLRAFGVRGRANVRAVVVWFALAHNLLRTLTLRAARAT